MAKDPSTENARLDREVMRMARVVASRRNLSVPAYLKSKLLGPVGADYDAELAAMAKERGAELKPKRKPAD